MLDKIKAWLYARLHLKLSYTVPGTQLRFDVVINRVTGWADINYDVPTYVIQVENARQSHEFDETVIRVFGAVHPGSDNARRLQTPFN